MTWLDDFACGDDRRRSLAHAKRREKRFLETLHKARSNIQVQIRLQVPSPKREEGDSLASVEEKRHALVKLYRQLNGLGTI